MRYKSFYNYLSRALCDLENGSLAFNILPPYVSYWHVYKFKYMLLLNSNFILSVLYLF